MNACETGLTVFVVDDDAAVCDALGMLLQSAGMEVETFRSAAAFLKALRPGQTGCLVLDIRMPGMSGLDLQDELHKRKIAIPIVFLTGHGDVPMAVRALKKGAVDFIEKPHEEERLVLSVLNALRMDGERRKQANRHDDISADLATRLATLSEREREVLDRILEGKQTRQITDELHIGVKTVEFHRANIREKLGVATQAQLFSLFIPSEGDA
ncbi:response regulator transcription factor [Propionivibrio sp.]|uniref:response regulator transcription factor n=1 Tax=Propionivibrio sp. TaxID=2212460 RepID=UPI003BF3B7F3